MEHDRKYRILIAEDDGDIVEVLKLYLENEGYEVLSAPDGRQAAELLRTEPTDLGIFDIMMPEMNGYDLIREVRKTSDMPIIVLSARQEDSDKIIGLDLGADDYMTKPFSPPEVVARVRAQLRRYHQMRGKQDSVPRADGDAGAQQIAAGTDGPETHPGEKTVLSAGALQVDLKSLSLTKNGVPVNVTPTELKILVCLMQHPGKVFTKVQLFRFLNGSYIPGDENALMVHISNLREKIEDDPRHPLYLLTVRGLGYKFRGSMD